MPSYKTAADLDGPVVSGYYGYHNSFQCVCPVEYVVESTYSNGKYYININNRQINSLEPQREKYVIKATAVESIHSARDARREGRKLVACFLPEFRTSLR